jgi:uncharacterized protein Usg
MSKIKKQRLSFWIKMQDPILHILQSTHLKDRAKNEWNIKKKQIVM